jgi:hypothetical protein
MATFEKIATVDVGLLGAGTIDFTSIPATFTDLAVLISARGTSLSSAYGALTFNSVTSGYSERLLYGTGSGSGQSANTSGSSFVWSNLVVGAGKTANTFSNCQIYIPNYAGSTNKSISCESVTEDNATAADIYVNAGLWSNTSAITSISLAMNVGSFAQYSSATLYGIKKA